MTTAPSETPFGFRFSVDIFGLRDGAVLNQAFVRVSSIESVSEVISFTLSTDTYINGEPGRASFSEVELERIYDGLDPFYRWRRQIERGQQITYDVSITVLDVAQQPVRRMILYQAWPRKWVMPDLNATVGAPAVERITLSFAEAYEGEAR